jgi:hypothetical protein
MAYRPYIPHYVLYINTFTFFSLYKGTIEGVHCICATSCPRLHHFANAGYCRTIRSGGISRRGLRRRTRRHLLHKERRIRLVALVRVQSGYPCRWLPLSPPQTIQST